LARRALTRFKLLGKKQGSLANLIRLGKKIYLLKGVTGIKVISRLTLTEKGPLYFGGGLGRKGFKYLRFLT